MLRLRKFMFDRVYLGPRRAREHERVRRVLRGLFDHYMEHPDEAAGAGAGGERLPARHRLPGRDDRPLLHRQVHRAGDSQGGRASERAARRYGEPLALISTESLERVKQAADIVEVISAHTDLRRQGARWVGLCPFHEERTPSFSVDAQEKLYHCFGCGVGGDTIKFVEEKEGLGFAEAVELLADRYGVELEREKEDPRAEARRQQRRRLSELLDRTAAFYAALPLGLRGGGQGARLPGRARAGRGGAARLRRRLRAERLGHGAAARPAGRLQRRGAARRRAGAARRGGRRVRPLPLADHVPDPRPPRPDARLRRAGDALRPGGQVRQHRRDRLLPQEPACSTASTWPRRRSPRPGGRSWSRATPTCWRCTRRGSRRRSG